MNGSVVGSVEYIFFDFIFKYSPYQIKLLNLLSCDGRDGYNQWRDAKKPGTLLAELCRKNGIPSPEYRELAVKVLNKIFKIPNEDFPEGL